MSENNIELEEQKKIDIEFLLRLYFHFYKLDIIIKGSLNMGKIWDCYFINKNIIEKYKNFYEYNQLEDLINTPEIKDLINKNQDESKYIYEKEINIIIKKIISMLSKEYKEKIQNKNNEEFIKEINNPKLYSLNTHVYENPKVININNCVIVRKEIVKLLKENKNKNIIDQINGSQFSYLINNNKSICIYGKTINLGILKESYIFQSEIIIRFQDQDAYDSIINDLEELSFDYFLNNINIIENNIGKYKNTNNKLIILEEKYLTKKNPQNNINKDNIIKNFNTQGIFHKKQKRPLPIDKTFSKQKNIKLLIYIMIDLSKIKKKSEISLNNNKSNEKYFPVKSEFFNNFLEKNNLLRIFQDENLNSIINNSDINLSNEDIFQNIIKSSVMNKFKTKNDSVYSDNDIFPKKKFIGKNIFYYENFVLLNRDTINLMDKSFSIFESYNISYYYKDKKIYMIFNLDKCIEIYSLNKENYLTPEQFFIFDCLSIEYKEQFLLLTKIGYKEYTEKYTILMENDYASPIFLNDNKIIGYTYIYDKNNKNYNNDLLKNDKLVGMIKLYFDYTERKIKSNKIRNMKYHLVNIQLMKRLRSEYDYPNLENKLNEINEVKKIIDSIKKGNNEYSNSLITYKNIYLIMKKLPNEINNKFKKQYPLNDSNDKTLEEIGLKTVNNNNNKIIYYDNFELITDEIYNLLFKNKNKDYLEKYYINFNSTKKYLYFLIPEIINSGNEQKYILEVGFLNEDIFNPNYILVYNTKENYEQALNNNLDILLDNYNFENNNFGKLYNGKNDEIGLIYNLREIPIKININETKRVLNAKIFDNLKNSYQYVIKEKVTNKKNFMDIEDNIKNVPNPQKKMFSPKPNLNKKKIQYKNKRIINEFKTPILIGLQFIGGAPIYMNSVLQCFCQIEDLINYFKYKEKVESIINKYKLEKKENLTSSFKLLIETIWASNGDKSKKNLLYNGINYYFAPYDIKNKFNLFEPNFPKSIMPNDLINLIISYLHSELGKNNQNNLHSQILLDYSNENEVLENFKNDFKMNGSKISDIFYGVNQICSVCPKCNSKIYEFKSFYSLYFDVWKVKSFKNGNNYNNNLLDVLNINDCLNYYRRNDNQNANNIFCQKCQTENKCFKITSIYTSPKTLIISLNLKTEFQRQIKFNLEEYLNLTKYVKATNQYIYDLIGIVACDLQTGQYIAFCKNPINNQWYEYIEDLVILVKNNIINVINNSFFPCILFYQNKNNN